MAAQKSNKSATELAGSLGLNEINELLRNKKKLWWLNFQTGLMRGFSGVLGAALAIILIGSIVAAFGGLPVIGNFLQKLGQATK